jgi:long-chain acyl-CoA synthetase
MIGATNVLIADPRNLRGLVKEFSKHRITCFAGVNRLFAALVDDPAFARLDFSKLSIAASGGSPLMERVATKWKAITGKTLIEAYGLTETSPVVTCNPVDLQAFNASCGLPLPSTDISIRGGDDAELPVGQAGELLVRGPQVMKEYWNQPEETAKAMTSDGFFRTGDIATIDAQGFVRIVDRKKDMINVGGLKVYPNEVEEVVAMHPGVAEVCAFGVPDEKSGEKVKVAVVRRDPALESAELEGFCRKYLAAYKVPRVVEFRSELPKTTLGKTLRRVLRSTSA